MKGYSVAVAFNAISIIIFFLLLSYCINVEGMRPLKHNHQSAPSSFAFKEHTWLSTTAGGVRFRKEVGAAYAKQTLHSATRFIWMALEQILVADRKIVQKVSLIVEDMDGVAYASNNEIHLSASYVGNYSSGNVKTEITGVLYHEMTHIWQWNGKDEAPGGLIEGIADFVRLKAGYAPSHWVKPGQGNTWDQGYDVTAYFLDYCNTLKSGFMAQLNKMMRTGYSDQYFVQLLGKTVDQLWEDYKANYAN